ncbi:YbaB/EbfC family nucleoid-associated protein [Nocardia sp. NPDC003482]
MTNERASRADLAGLIDDVQEQLRTIARLQMERAELVATATVRKRVTVTVNADNTIIDTTFGPDIEDLTYPEIAKAITEAAQQASAEVARKTRDLFAPLQDQRARLPKLTELVEGMPDLSLPEPPRASIDPPRRRPASDGSMRFTDVEAFDHERDRNHRATDSGW